MRRAKNLQSSFRVYRCLVRECLAEGLARPRLASPRPAGSDSASGETSYRPMTTACCARGPGWIPDLRMYTEAICSVSDARTRSKFT
jgi:hypothetical protein